MVKQLSLVRATGLGLVAMALSVPSVFAETYVGRVDGVGEVEVELIAKGTPSFPRRAKSYGVSSSLDLTSSMSIGGTATYAADKLGYEVNANAGVISMFANGDEDNKLQHIGAGVKGSLNGLDLYAEASYDTDAEDLTPAVGVSFKF